MKLRKISEITATLPFTEFDFLQKYRESFAVSELGRIHAQLPLKELADKIRSHFPQKHPQGNKPMFSPEGEVALMFLKSYTGQSDDGLVEMLNSSIHMQMFCGVLIDPEHPIRDGKIVRAIRNRMARSLDIRELQKVLYGKWGNSLRDKDLCLTDATCYESHLRFPTDVKLLWECCEWLQALISKTCKHLKERLPRNKYRDIDRARLAYAKQASIPGLRQANSTDAYWDCWPNRQGNGTGFARSTPPTLCCQPSRASGSVRLRKYTVSRKRWRRKRR